MRDKVVAEILNGIKRVEEQPIHHVLRLQFLFDVKYLTTLLVPVENEVSINPCTMVTGLITK
jgi:hypothetical protein